MRLTFLRGNHTSVCTASENLFLSTLIEYARQMAESRFSNQKPFLDTDRVKSNLYSSCYVVRGRFRSIHINDFRW
jgi:hypothetical protein